MAFAIVPAYNESTSIRATIEGLLGVPQVEGVLVVDDGSRDATAQIVAHMEDERVMLSRLTRNRGKGGALNHGMKLLEGRNIDVFLFCDADLGATSREVENLIRPVLSDEAEMATALFPPSGGGGGFGLAVGTARLVIRLAAGSWVQAPLSGQRAFTPGVWRAAGPCAPGFGAEAVFTARALRAGFSLVEVPTTMRHRVTGNNARDVLHRARQMWDLLRGLVPLLMRRGDARV